MDKRFPIVSIISFLCSIAMLFGLYIYTVKSRVRNVPSAKSARSVF